ncbi:MAG: DUF2190 family protein [Blastopirellula sp. JB062]
MQAEFVQGSPLRLDHTPASDIAAGSIVVIGNHTAGAGRSIAANDKGALETGGGVYRVAVATGASTAIADRATLYWDAGNEVLTTDDNEGANKQFGYADGATVDADAFTKAVHQPAV